MTIKIKKLHKDAKIPEYAHGADQDAGLDLCAVEEVLLTPGIPSLVKTGLSIELPTGYEAQIRSRSGLALKYGIRVLNSPGTIDPSYRGEIGVILQWDGWKPNYDRVKDGWQDKLYRVMPGDRIAQMVIAQYCAVDFEEAELTDSERGAGAFGSTGR